MSTPPVNSDTLDQMYQDAAAACQRIWNAINDARNTGVQIHTSLVNGNLVVTAIKGQQKVWIDAPSPMNYGSLTVSETPAETRIAVLVRDYHD